MAMMIAKTAAAVTTHEAQYLLIQNTIWFNLVDRLLDSNYLFEMEIESNNCLIPSPWTTDEKLSIPYGKADIPFLKKLLYSSNSIMISKSLLALIERAYDCFKAMDMLKYDVLSPLNRLLMHNKPFIRQRCCTLIKILSAQPLGKVSIVRNGSLMCKMQGLMADAVYGVRFHCAAALMSMAEHRPGNEAMVELGCADQALSRVYVEQDDRVVPALLCIVGRLMATNRMVRERISGTADFGRFFDNAVSVTKRQRSASTGALVDRGDPTAGRGLLGFLKQGARSSDYRTALDSVVCMARAAAVREASVYLARDHDVIDLLVSYVTSPGLRGRALRVFSAQLLFTLASTSVGLVNLRKSVAVAADAVNDWIDVLQQRRSGVEDAATERCLRKLADIIVPMMRQLQDDAKATTEQNDPNLPR